MLKFCTVTQIIYYKGLEQSKKKGIKIDFLETWNSLTVTQIIKWLGQNEKKRLRRNLEQSCKYLAVGPVKEVI